MTFEISLKLGDMSFNNQNPGILSWGSPDQNQQGDVQKTLLGLESGELFRLPFRRGFFGPMSPKIILKKWIFTKSTIFFTRESYLNHPNLGTIILMVCLTSRVLANVLFVSHFSASPS